MTNHTFLKKVLLLSMVFAGSHVLALKFSLYWTTGWFDSVMHIFGGFLGALIVLCFLYIIDIKPERVSRKIILFLLIVASVLAVGAVWELWEIFTGMTDIFTDLVDTVSDLIMDVIGATVGFIYYEKRLRTK